MRSEKPLPDNVYAALRTVCESMLVPEVYTDLIYEYRSVPFDEFWEPAVGGSDTPANQPERCIHGKIADDQHHRNGDSCFHPFRCLDRCEVPAPADQPPQVCNYGGRE